MTGFRFKTRKKRTEIEAPVLFVEEQGEQEPQIINGQIARSVIEYRVAKALWKMGKEFAYQYPLFGGVHRRGGYVIDFVIFGDVVPIPLEVQGNRWHTGNFSAEEMMREAIIESYMGTEIRYVWENQLQDDQSALEAVKKAIL